MPRHHSCRSRSRPVRARARAYPVPWCVDRTASPLFRLTNESDDVLRGVTVSVARRGRLSVGAPTIVAPGCSVSTMVDGRDIARDTVLIVRWFTPDGGEYLWQVSF